MSDQVIDLFEALRKSLQENPINMSDPKKPKRQKPAEKEPFTKAEFTVKAGKVQTKINAIVANHDKAMCTANNRINQKYREMVDEVLEGLKDGVVERLILPDFYVAAKVDEATEKLEDGEYVEITDEVAAQ